MISGNVQTIPLRKQTALHSVEYVDQPCTWARLGRDQGFLARCDIKQADASTHATAEVGFIVVLDQTTTLQLRPGGHDTLPAKPIDVSAFSYSKRTAHQSPLSFLKRGTGNGGTVIPFGSVDEPTASSGTKKAEGGARASARAAAAKKTKMRDFQVLWITEFDVDITSGARSRVQP